jgi:hypothetical protein
LGLALTIGASLALFQAIQNCVPYVAAARGQFYTPVANPSTSFIRMATDRMSLSLLRLAMWPCLIFLILQICSGYAIATLFGSDASSSTVRQFRSGLLVSLAMTAVFVTVIWISFAGTNRG